MPIPSAAGQTRRLERLIKVQKLLLEQNPTPLVYREVATTLRNMDQNEEAAQTLVADRGNTPPNDTGRTLGAIADLHRRAGKTEAALAEAARGRPAPPITARSSSSWPIRSSDLGKIDEALDILRKSIKNEPDNAQYRFVMGGLLAKFGRNEEAIKIFQELLKQFASNDEVVKLSHSNLSVIYVNQGDYAKGEAELEASSRSLPTTRASTTTWDTSTPNRARTSRRPRS